MTERKACRKLVQRLVRECYADFELPCLVEDHLNAVVEILVGLVHVHEGRRCGPYRVSWSVPKSPAQSMAMKKRPNTSAPFFLEHILRGVHEDDLPAVQRVEEVELVFLAAKTCGRRRAWRGRPRAA